MMRFVYHVAGRFFREGGILLCVLAIPFSILPGSVMSQDEKNPEKHLPDPTQEQKMLTHILQNLRNMYMDVYPKYQKLRLMRREGAGEGKRTKLRREIQDLIADRFENAEQQIQRVAQQTEKARWKRKAQKIREEVVDRFQQFLRRFLNDWEPENPQRVRKMNLRERINAGVAGPEALRKLFLNQLQKHLSSVHANSTPTITDRVQEVNEELEPLYWSLLNKYIELIKRVDEARKKIKEEKEKNKEKTASKQDGGSEANDEKDTKKEKEQKKQLKEVVEEVSREWKQFVETKQQEQEKYLNLLNRMMSLFRGREEYLYSWEKRTAEKVLSLKRRIGNLTQLQDNGKEMFNDRERIREILTRHGKLILKKYQDFLDGEYWPQDAYKKLVEQPVQDKKMSKETYDRMYEKFGGELKELEKEEVMNYTSLRTSTRLLANNLAPLAEQLRKEGDEEDKMGTVLTKLDEIARDAHRRLEKDIRAQRRYYEIFREMSYDGETSFKKRFGKRIEKLKKKLYGKGEPDVSSTQLKRRLKKLQKEVKKVLANAGDP